MGQQQLLLIIQVTLIVGVATIIAINTMGETTLSANIDSFRQEMARIAVSAQVYCQKPGQFPAPEFSGHPHQQRMVARVGPDQIDIALPGGELP